jgi:hypothetical protein
MSTHHDITEAELASMTRDMDQMHRDQALPSLRTAIGDWVQSFRDAGTRRPPRVSSRRTFLLGAVGAGAAGTLAAACGSAARTSGTVKRSEPLASSSRTGSSPGLAGDLAVAAMAASLENLGVYAYNAGLQAAQAGRLGSVPPVLSTFAKTAMSQHQDHAKAWNAALTAAGMKPVTTTDPALTPTVNQKFSQVTDLPGLAELALLIENIAAQTYQSAIPLLSASSSVSVAASIQPVEMQHAAILYYVLGRYPGIQGSQENAYASGSPLAFNPTTLARPATDLKGQ